MRRVLILAATAATAMTMLPASADAQTEPAPAPIGNGFQLNVGLVDQRFSLLGTVNATVPFQVGYHFERVSVLLGANLSRVGSNVETTMPGLPSDRNEQTTTVVQFAPTLRYYFADLRPSGLAPFLQGEFDIGFSAVDTSGEPSGSDEDDDNPITLGFGVGFGAEYLFSRHFGLTAEINLRYLHTSRTSDFGVGGESTQTVNVLSVGGTAGINIHF